MQPRPFDASPLSAGSEYQIDADLAAIAREVAVIAKHASRETLPLGLPKITLSKLPATDPALFWRDEQLAALDDAWADPQTNVVSLVAWGGVGKTALVNRWLLGMKEDGYRGAERVYGWSFYSQGAAEGRQASADPFIAAALQWFGDPDPTVGSPWDKGERLAELVQRWRTLLVLDGLEPLQHPPGEMEGRLKDPGLQCLLRALARDNPGLCVLTTRLAVEDIEDFTAPSAARVDLEHLSPQGGAEYLKHLGVKGTLEELEQAAREFDGHALALTLLGRYLAVACDGDVRRRDRIPELAQEPQRGGHAQRVMASYERWFEGRAELDILRVMGLFDRPADPGALDVLRTEPPIAGLTERLPGLLEIDYRHAVANLRQVRLLAEEAPHDPGALDCHPLVREHFGEQLERDNPDGWREAHARLYEYYKVQAPQYPNTLEAMMSLFAAVAHGCRAGRHQEAFDKVYLRISRRDQAFIVKKLGAIGADLAVLANFFDSPWREPASGLEEVVRARVLNWASYDLRALGRLAEAAQSLRTGLDIDLAREDWLNSAQAAGTISEIYLIIGDLAQALACARQALDLADRSGNIAWRMATHMWLADGLHQAGQLEEAEEFFRQAEAMQKERQPKYPILYSIQGYRYCDLLLGQGKSGEVIVRVKKMLEWGISGTSLLDIALEQLGLGRAYLVQGQRVGANASTLYDISARKTSFAQAATHLDRAVDVLRQAGRQDHLPLALLARAALRREQGQSEEARRDLEEALSITTRSGMRRHEADCRLEAARLHLACGEWEQARESLVRAKEMIGQMGYHRRDGDVTALEEQLAD
jgi:tetratricopeptide (TPR) repeat protein